jgi:hypothetical protein
MLSSEIPVRPELCRRGTGFFSRISLAEIPLIALFLFLAGCASPERTRTRGGGPGADIGNRAKVVEMHEGSQPFWKTPKVIPTKHPPLAPASQADQLSRQ